MKNVHKKEKKNCNFMMKILKYKNAFNAYRFNIEEWNLRSDL